MQGGQRLWEPWLPASSAGGGGRYFLLEQPYGSELKTLVVAQTNEALEVPTKTIQFPLEDGHREDSKIIFVRIVL